MYEKKISELLQKTRFLILKLNLNSGVFYKKLDILSKLKLIHL